MKLRGKRRGVVGESKVRVVTLGDGGSMRLSASGGDPLAGFESAVAVFAASMAVGFADVMMVVVAVEMAVLADVGLVVGVGEMSGEE